MIYRIIGVKGGKTLDGLDIAFCELEEAGGKWKYILHHTRKISYSDVWKQRVESAAGLSVVDYFKLDLEFGRYIGEAINGFIDDHRLHHQVQLVGSFGQPVIHNGNVGINTSLGSGAAIAALTGINVISDFYAMDLALGGQGLPVTAVADRLLFPDTKLHLHLGGNASIIAALPNGYVSYDICPVNILLNKIARRKELPFDENGSLAADGFVRDEWLAKLNQQAYYAGAYPKSLNNDFALVELYPILQNANLSVADALRTSIEHIIIQVTRNIGRLIKNFGSERPLEMIVSGGGVYNNFLIERLTSALKPMHVSLVIPEIERVDFAGALSAALLAALRWREESTSITSATGATRVSVGGAVWIGTPA